MHIVGAFEAKNTLGALLDRVEKGEDIVITRHGKPVARLVQPDVQKNQNKALVGLDSFRAEVKQFKLGAFDWKEWKAYRDEGRR